MISRVGESSKFEQNIDTLDTINASETLDTLDIRKKKYLQISASLQARRDHHDSIDSAWSHQGAQGNIQKFVLSGAGERAQRTGTFRRWGKQTDEGDQWYVGASDEQQ